MKKIIAFLISLSVVRWAWFLGVEKLPAAAEVIGEGWAELTESPFGEWFAGLEILETFPWLVPVGQWLWSAAMWRIPAALAAMWLAGRYYPAMKIACGRFCDFLNRLHIRHRREKHVVLRIFSPDRRTEKTVDLGDKGTHKVSDRCTITMDSGIAYMNGGRMEEDRWYTTEDKYSVKLTAVNV